MKRITLAVAALFAGLLFYCPKVYASDEDLALKISSIEAGHEDTYDTEIAVDVIIKRFEVNEAEDDILPKAGFQEFIDEIEVEEVAESMQAFPSYILTAEDEDLILRLAVLEAGDKDVDGMANVMQVVLNRFESDKFPNSIRGVIFQSGQFCTASRLATANISDEAREALNKVVWGEYKWNECHYFESCDGLAFAGWSTYIFSYGGHDFYKAKS